MEFAAKLVCRRRGYFQTDTADLYARVFNVKVMNVVASKEILIKKASGEMEPFSEAKLRRSLKRIKASKYAIEKIISHIRKELKTGIPTSFIYRHAFSLLRREERSAANRYSLKRAIMELGPTGHPFEALIGELLKSEGFSVKVGQVVPGLCVRHEVDVVATKPNQCIIVECKFHNQFGIKSDVKTALYVQARFEDIQREWQRSHDGKQKFNEVRLVTNTKLTSDAIRYSQCAGIKAIGWNYPQKHGLEAQIDRAGLYPITSLTTLSRYQKQYFLDNGLVLCKDVLARQDLIRSLGIQKSKAEAVKTEINQLCVL